MRLLALGDKFSGGVQIGLEDIPFPSFLLDGDGAVLGFNSAYVEQFGESVEKRHRRKAELAGKGESVRGLRVRNLADRKVLVILDPDTEESIQRERLVREATTMARVGGFELDVDTKFFSWTPEVYDIHGLDRDFIPTLESVFSLYSETARSNLERLFIRTFEQGGSFDIELPMTNRKGRRLWLRFRGRAVVKGGRCVTISGAVQDISPEHAVRQKLAEVLERFAFAQRSAVFGVWDFYPAAGTLHWDQAMFPLYDVDPSTFTGKFEDWCRCVYPDDLETATGALQAAIRGESVFDTEFRIVTSSGESRWIKATAHITRGEDGRAERLVGFNYDITKSKLIEEALRSSFSQLEETNSKLKELAATSQAASRAKSEFLANMSHEIRTPMNGVVGMASLLLESELAPHQRDAVEIVRKSADALLQLINDLLDFSKVEAGAVELVATSVDLRETVDDLVEFLAIDAQRKGLHFRYVVAREVPARILVDAGRLRQILINLVGNAVKYTDRGYVSLAVSLSQGNVVFSVSDSGRGIPQLELETLFAPFTRGSNQGAIGGTGLGLAICYRLASIMGGRITVSSVLGEGSCFQFSLPFSPQAKSEGRREFVGIRAAVSGGSQSDRESVAETMRYLGAEMVVNEPTLEFVFHDQNPEFETANKILLLPSSEAAVVAPYKEAGFKGMVTLPVRASQVMKVIGALTGRLASESSSLERRLVFDCDVLLVEDNPVNQRVAWKMFDKLGLRFDTASDGRDALRWLNQRRYDLVFMDLQMPEMDGYETTEALRRAEGLNRETPIVALTAHATQEHRVRCLEAGFSDFLTKPLRVGDLRKVLAKWLPGRVREA